jgi:hypothetical protein
MLPYTNRLTSLLRSLPLPTVLLHIEKLEARNVNLSFMRIFIGHTFVWNLDHGVPSSEPGEDAVGGVFEDEGLRWVDDVGIRDWGRGTLSDVWRENC